MRGVFPHSHPNMTLLTLLSMFALLPGGWAGILSLHSFEKNVFLPTVLFARYFQDIERNHIA